MLSKILLFALIAFVSAENKVALWGFPTNNIRACDKDEDCGKFGDKGATCLPEGMCKCSGTGTYDHKTFWGRTFFVCVPTAESVANFKERTVDIVMTFTFPEAKCENITEQAFVDKFESLFNTLLASKVVDVVPQCDPVNIMVRATVYVEEVYDIMPRIGSDLQHALIQDAERLVADESVSFMMQKLGPIDHSLTHVTTVAGAANLCKGHTTTGSTLTVRAAGMCRAMYCEDETSLYLKHNGNCILRPVLPAEENRSWTTGIIIAVALGGVLACIVFVGLVFVCCLGDRPEEDVESA